MLLGRVPDFNTECLELITDLALGKWPAGSDRYIHLDVGADRYVIIRTEQSVKKPSEQHTQGSQIIPQLERAGIILLKHHTDIHFRHDTDTANTKRIRLSGGSICDTSLNLTSWIIEKRIGQSRLANRIDAVDRHLAEFRFMANVPENCQKLFPSATLLDDKRGKNLNIEFVAGYSLGERVIRGELSGHRLCGIIDNLICELKETLWSSVPRQPQRNYVDIVKRRFGELTGVEFFDRIWTEGAIVNGIELPSVEALLRSVQERWPLLMHLDGTGAHGDLVLEDIVLSLTSGKDNCKLIDPNPQNVSRFVDYAKLMMSAALKYEVIYEGCFRCDLSMSGDRIQLAYALEESDAWRCLEDLREYLQHSVYNEREIPSDLWPDMLMAQACLHMFALPAFHHLQHGKFVRSLIFTAVAMTEMYRVLV
jgi:hypothetical protein